MYPQKKNTYILQFSFCLYYAATVLMVYKASFLPSQILLCLKILPADSLISSMNLEEGYILIV